MGNIIVPKNAIWIPQPKQAVFMSRPEYEVLYGGAAGGGKSDAIVCEALRQVHIPHYKGLILRKTFPQLAELIDKSLNYYPRAFPKARYNAGSHTWFFPSGAKIIFGSMQHTKDRTNYQGKAYDFIAFDELTQFTWEEYSYLMSRNRPNGPGTRVYLRATANPGGVGHGWVKERFITAAPAMKPIPQEVEYERPDGSVVRKIQYRCCVRASVFDNPKLLENDPDYPSRLAAMPDAEREALLYGNWDSFSGQVFSEWVDDPAHYGDYCWSHVVEPFLIPDYWPIYRGFDWGYARPFSVGWWAVGRNGELYRIRELYGCTGTPNEGVKWTPEKLAKVIYEIEHDDPNLRGHRITGIADPAIWDASSGESIADVMERHHVYFDKADHARISGKMQVHNRLAFDAEGKAMLYVFKTCSQFIRTMPALVYDQTNVEDVDTKGEDHIYDETRYVCMEHQIRAREHHKPTPRGYDPLEEDKKNGNQYALYL